MCTHSREIITGNIVNAQLLEGHFSIFLVGCPSPPKTKLNSGTTMLCSIHMQLMPLWPSRTVQENILHFFPLIHYSVEKNVKPAKKIIQILPLNKILMLPLCFETCISDWVKQQFQSLPKNVEAIAIIFNLNCNWFSLSFFNVLVPLVERDFLYSMSLKTAIAKI